MEKGGLESRVKDFVQRHRLILPGGTVVVGVSGGADSVCLLHFLARWQSAFHIKLHVAHLDHQLRGTESLADLEYVTSLTDSLGLPMTIGRQDVAAYKAERRCSLEEAARELRHEFLAEVARNVGADRIAIGHTQDDQVETVLMHILRGTGTSGLCGLEPCSPMAYSGHLSPVPAREHSSLSLRALRFPCHSEPELRAKRGGSEAISLRSGPAPRSDLWVIRPLLGITRGETLNYCQGYQLKPRFDSSNLSLSFLRNRCRLELLPLLREYNPGVDQAFLRLAEIAGDDKSFIEEQALQLWGEVARQEDNAIYLDKRKTCALPLALQRQLIRLASERALGDTRDIEAAHVEAIRHLLAKPVGKRISLPRGLLCWAGYDEVVITISRSLEGRGGVEGRFQRTSQSSLSENEFQLAFPPIPFPPLRGEFPLRVPGETILPGWQVIASILSASARQSLEHTGSRPPFVLASEAKQSHRSFVAHLDLHQTGTELFVRQRQPGDRFHPLGMNMAKKLQAFMVDAKIPLHWRDHIPLVCSPRQIIWVVGWQIDDRAKVTEATKEILRLEFVGSS